MRQFFQKVITIIKSLLLMTAVMLMIIGAKAFANRTSPPPIEPLDVKYEIHDPNCGIKGEVINVWIDVKVSGGVSPYNFEPDPKDLVYSELPDGGIKFRLGGGQTVILRVKSDTPNGEPKLTRDIYVPSHLTDCDGSVHTMTPTSTPTPTPSATSTATSMPTKTIAVSSTATKDDNGNRNPNSSSTRTATVTATNTPTDAPTRTPTDAPTRTPTDAPTRTPTDAPTATSTRAPTSTPTFISVPPNVAECEDGIDNDHDGKIDLHDPNCKSSQDNHEDK